ncbi:aminoglycoside phosphotransferase family protein [Oceanidesulfovibrio marinus]|uniref:Aminoglycoside phosphotransferase family protein n=1 Tax=Oceanidesulfovibrio marinus TaxID=370038 RepID=A0ABX6NJ33_9BACT|nr:aminoglycoside phosphotransferase family protein [Oceanidesulfovibrio marinus]QJT10664.1 aminoglycoside phosphotransferase family protein [Oceanidesulfovibrio marinus]
MIELKTNQLQAFLQESFGPKARLLGISEIGKPGEQGVKQFGYGKPVLVSYEIDGEPQEAVLSTMRGDKYGHQFYWDRAAILMFQHETGGGLEKHARSLALGYIDQDDALHPVRDVQEFFLLVEKLPGYDYYRDLERIMAGDFRPSDVDQVRESARWMARIHSRRLDDPHLYYRRIRNLIGSDECVLGLVDEAYPQGYEDYPPERFQALERRLIDWRWKLKRYAHRLAEVHGDFHPWNVLIDERGGFRVLDRSRGEWGEPAGDVASMAMNYLLFGILDDHPDDPDATPRLSGPFRQLFEVLFEEYLEATGDREILEVIAPFFVFRCLVVASPEWYPNHPPAVRRSLFEFMERVLAEDVFDPTCVNKYLVGSC